MKCRLAVLKAGKAAGEACQRRLVKSAEQYAALSATPAMSQITICAPTVLVISLPALRCQAPLENELERELADARGKSAGHDTETRAIDIHIGIEVVDVIEDVV